jgi:MSHA pilin protein MshD
MSIKRMSGFTLVEMIIAIVVISVGVAGVLSAFMTSVKGSGDAAVGKQLVAIADEMMEEVLLRPYGSGATATAGNAMGCGSSASRAAFDEVGDYNGYQTTDVCDIDGVAVPGLGGYTVSVIVQSATLGAPAVSALRITVTAASRGQSIVLDGFRTGYGSL